MSTRKFAARKKPQRGFHVRHWALLLVGIVSLSLTRCPGGSHAALMGMGYLSYPEINLFDIRPGPLLNCHSPVVLGQTPSLQLALRACLALPDCLFVQWERSTQTTTSCQGLAALPPMRRCAGREPSAFFSARKSRSKGTSNCAPGMFFLEEMNMCHVCPNGTCGTLPGARVVAGFSDIPLQKMVQQTMGVGRGYRAYNPSIVSYHGKIYLSARVSDYTVCPEEFQIDKSLAVKNAFHSHEMVCPLDDAMLPRLDACTIVHWNPTSFKNSSFDFAEMCAGLEDARSFVWQDRVHWVGTINEDPEEKTNGRGCWSKKVYHVGMAKLTESLENIESGYIPESRFQGINQKNWAPLEFNNTLYFVVRTEPLIINKLDASGSSIYQSGPAIQTSLQAVLPEGASLNGGTPFIPLGGNRFLALVHHSIRHLWGPNSRHSLQTVRFWRWYNHHFVILSVVQDSQNQPQFLLDWVSEAFRLPEGPEGTVSPIQFAAGLIIKRDTLYISYGWSDCFTALAEVKDIYTKLQIWQELGMGTQEIQAIKS